MPTKKTISAAPKTHHFVKKEALKFGFETVKKNFLFFLSLIIIVLVVYIAGEIFKGMVEQNNNLLLSFSYSIFSWIINSIVAMGIIKICLDFVDKKKPILSELLYTKSLPQYLGVSIIKNVIIIIGVILLIIPGIIFAIKLQFAEYLVVDKGMGIMEALKGSWEMTKGVKWNLFLFWILIGLINILGLLALVLGLLITVPLTWVATAYVYRKLLARA